MPSTTEALLDVNVLIACVFEDHPHYVRAAGFVAQLDHFYTCPTTQGGFLRFATRSLKDGGVPQAPRLSMAKAQARLKDLTSVDGHVFMPDDLAFTELSLRSMVGHKQWTDGYLLGLARRHALSLATIDSRIAVLDDPVTPILIVLS